VWRWEFLDDVGYLSPEELASLIVACHEVAQRNLPLLFVGAGLRRLPPFPAMHSPMPNAISPIPKSVTAARAAPSTQRRTKALISKTMRSKKFCA
jgi:hypothetical protein